MPALRVSAALFGAVALGAACPVGVLAEPLPAATAARMPEGTAATVPSKAEGDAPAIQSGVAGGNIGEAEGTGKTGEGIVPGEDGGAPAPVLPGDGGTGSVEPGGGEEPGDGSEPNPDTPATPDAPPTEEASPSEPTPSGSATEDPVADDESASSSTAEGEPSASEGATEGQASSKPEFVEVEEGVYEIKNSSSGKALDVAGGKSDSRTNVQGYAANHTPAQRWRIERSGGHYVIVNVGSGKVLDVSGGKAAGGTNVWLYAANGTTAQLWDFVRAENGGYLLYSALGSFVLDLSASGNAQIMSPGEVPAQVWQLIAIKQSIANGVYSFSSQKNHGFVMDVYGGSRSNGAKVQSYASNESLAQYWKVSFDKKTGYYTLRSAASGKMLDARGGKTTSGTKVQQYGSNGTAAQWWRIVVNADGSLTLFNAKRGLALDLTGGKAANGTALQLYTPNGTAAQRWVVNRIDSLVSSGLYQFGTSLNSDRALDVYGGSRSASAKLQLYGVNKTLAQKWVVAVNDDGTFTIKNAQSGRYLESSSGKLANLSGAGDAALWSACVSNQGGLSFLNVATGLYLDVRGGSSASGTLVQLYAGNGTAAQAWFLTVRQAIENGYCAIKNLASGKVLDVAGGSRSKGAKVQLYSSNGTAAQVWKVTSVGGGKYTLVCYGSNMALDVPSGKPKAGLQLQQYGSNGTAAQKWLISIAEDGGLQIVSSLGDGQYALASSSSSKAVLALMQSVLEQRWAYNPVDLEKVIRPLTARQKRVVRACKTTPSPGPGWCAAWVTSVMGNAGIPTRGMDACDMARSWCKSSNISDLEVGMIIAVPSHPHTAMGRIYGHVCIYVGDGMVMDNVGTIRTVSLDSWLRKYGATYTPKWGWYNNVKLA